MKKNKYYFGLLMVLTSCMLWPSQEVFSQCAALTTADANIACGDPAPMLNAGVMGTCTIEATTADALIDIPDNGFDGTLASMACQGITLPAGAFSPSATITNIEVDLTITHTWVGDLVVTVEAPDGNILPLFSRPGEIEVGDGTLCCGNNADTEATVLNFADANPNDAEDMGDSGNDVCTPTTTGTGIGDGICDYFPNPDQATIGTVTNFAGLNAPANLTGAWSLCGGDAVGADVGSLDSWSLTIEYTDEPTWWNTAAAGMMQGSGTTFDPTGTMAEEGAFDNNTEGTYTYYVQPCPDCPREAVTVTVGSCGPMNPMLEITDPCNCDNGIDLDGNTNNGNELAQETITVMPGTAPYMVTDATGLVDATNMPLLGDDGATAISAANPLTLAADMLVAYVPADGVSTFTVTVMDAAGLTADIAGGPCTQCECSCPADGGRF